MQLISRKRPEGGRYQRGSLAELPEPASTFLYTDVRSSQPIRGDVPRRSVSAYVPGFTADRGSASEGPRQAPPLTTSHCATQHDRSQVPARCTTLLEPRQGTEEGLDVGFQLKATERAADVQTSGVALYGEEQAPRHRGRTSVSGRWMRPARRLVWEIRSGKVFF